jgi:hypothetical protein
VNNAPNIKKLSLPLPDFGRALQKAKKKVYSMRFLLLLHKLYSDLHFLIYFQAMKAMNEYLVHLGKLKKLTHLAKFLENPYFQIMNRRWPAFIRRVAVAIPSLVYLQVNYKGSSNWVYLERDGTGKYLRCFYLEEEKGRVSKVDPEEWGDFYSGMALW